MALWRALLHGSGMHLQCWREAAQAPSVGRALHPMPPRSPAGRDRRKPVADEAQGDGLPWPLLREQQSLQARWGEAERIAAAERAQVLITQGYGPLLPWLEAPGTHPGEAPAAATDRKRPARHQQRRALVDLFDAA
jgi:hypothetical protein